MFPAGLRVRRISGRAGVRRAAAVAGRIMLVLGATAVPDVGPGRFPTANA
jgi:hypothetical protein